MKGLVFTTFFDFCEEQYGADVLDDAIEAAELPNGGSYTSVGTYAFEEMVTILTKVVQLTGVSFPVLLENFGAFCFSAWVKKFPASFDNLDLFDVLANIDRFHEQQVRTLYPDAELPSFKVIDRGRDSLVLDYHSCKPLADLAVGVIKGAAAYLGTPVSVSHRPTGGAARFEIRHERARAAA